MKGFRTTIVTLLLFAAALTPAMAAGDMEGVTASDSVIPEETVELTVYTQLANYSGEQIGWFAQVMEERFNVKLNIIPEGDGVFTTRMAGGDLGDIVVFGTDADEYEQAWQAGLLWDWEDEDLLEEYGPYIAENMQPALAKNRSISGGDLYGFGHDVATSPDDHESFFYHPDIRWDLYADLGYPEIDTLEDYIDVLEDMVDLQPTSDTGAQTYGVSLFSDWDGDMVMFVKSTAALYGYDEFGFGLYDTNTDTYQHLFAEDSFYIRSLRFYNELYQRGLLDPDSLTQNYDLHNEKYQSGAAFFIIFDWMGSGTYNTDEHLAEGRAMLPRPASDARTLTYGLNVSGRERVWTIGAKTQYPELAMTIINWLATPEGTMTTTYGPQGVTWDYDEEGYAYLTEFGERAYADQTTEMTGGYTGTFSDGTSKINNTIWSLGATNPQGNDEPYDYQKWRNRRRDDVTAIEQDWRDYTGFRDYDAYIESFGYSVAPGTSFSQRSRSSELQTTWNQVAEAIKTYSWRAIYADTDEEFEEIVADMEDEAMAYGYDECRAFTEEEAARRAELARAVREQ